MTSAEFLLLFIESAANLTRNLSLTDMGIDWCNRGDHFTWRRCSWRHVRPGLRMWCCALCVGERDDGPNFNAPARVL